MSEPVARIGSCPLPTCTNFAVTGYAAFARTQFLDVTTAAWTAIGVVVVLAIVLARTIAGRYMYGGTALTFTVLAGIVVGGTSILGGVILLLAVGGDAWSRLRTG
jgi:hypothetical protein